MKLAIAQSHPTVVDLGGVRGVDNIGVGTLVVTNRILHQVSIDLVVRRPTTLVRVLLGMAGTATGTGSVATRRLGPAG